MTQASHLLPAVDPGEIGPGYLRQLVGTDAPVILEIGANNGMHTQAFLSLFPKARIYAFEPDPRAVAKFKANIRNPRVQLIEGAVGAYDGEGKFYVSSGLPPGVSADERAQFPFGWDMSGSLRAPKTHKQVWPWCKFESTITVPVTRLDTWTRRNHIDAVDFIWSDIQGAEGDLIEGGKITLSKTRYFYTEYSNDEWYEGQPTLSQLMRMLENFTLLRRYRMDALFKNTAL